MASSKNQEREAREARDRLKAYNARQAVHSHQVRRRRRDNLVAGLGVLVIAAAATATQLYYFNGGPGTPTPEPSTSASAQAGANVGDVPSTALSEFRTWTGELVLNDVALAIELDGAAAPQAVASFVTDAKTGYFNGKNCHRLLADEQSGLIQCGSEDGLGSSNPNYAYGPIENAPADGIYPAGTIAIARGDSAFSNGHQFFITFVDTPLPATAAGGYTVIGHVTGGIDQLLAKIVSGGIVPGSEIGAGGGTPAIETKITRVTVQ